MLNKWSNRIWWLIYWLIVEEDSLRRVSGRGPVWSQKTTRGRQKHLVTRLHQKHRGRYNNPSVLTLSLNPSRNTETIIFSCSPSLCVLTWAGLLSQIDQWDSNPAGEAIDDRNTAFNSLSLSSRSPLLSATRLLLLSTYVWQLDGSVRYQNISHNDTHLQRRVLIMTSDCL